MDFSAVDSKMVNVKYTNDNRLIRATERKCFFVDASEAYPAFLIRVSNMIYIYTLQRRHTDKTVSGQNRLLARKRLLNGYFWNYRNRRAPYFSIGFFFSSILMKQCKVSQFYQVKSSADLHVLKKISPGALLLDVTNNLGKYDYS